MAQYKFYFVNRRILVIPVGFRRCIYYLQQFLIFYFELFLVFYAHFYSFFDNMIIFSVNNIYTELQYSHTDRIIMNANYKLYSQYRRNKDFINTNNEPEYFIFYVQ